jgi:AmiR/NasT family two-component response regulator
MIGEAVGMLKQRHHLSTETAFQMLVQLSQTEHVKLREIARRITAVDWLP